MKTLEENRAFVKAMHEVVELYGRNFVFHDVCWYFDRETGQSLCIVGKALERVGLSAEEFFKIRHSNGVDYNTTGALRLLTDLGYNFIVAEAANKAQEIQDGRDPANYERGSWGKSLAAFRKMLKGTEFLD